ncbi:hypothetical protein GCM10007913_11670 [Devosia yakushimensis]|uniref:Protamine-2 (Modular protein) n=1 Tax=Devosia yakushimensis TaxID=470028 RepID=A0ABQ5UDF6_9HYPH|nr:hypothetical protein GCM10007913_11670 [Devosia yakushimensis]
MKRSRSLFGFGGIVAASAMALGAMIAMAPTPAELSGQVKVTPTPPAGPERAPAPQQAHERVAMREERVDRYRFGRSLPVAHKNRAGGERAHRRWRKRRAAGRG